MPVAQVERDQRADAPADEHSAGGERAPNVVAHLHLLIPGVLMVIVGFRAGGYFPDATALAAVAIAVVLVLRVAFSKRPFARQRLPYVLCASALGLFALWTLLSGVWSRAPSRAIVEYDRAVLYALLFVALGAWGRSAQSLRWMLRVIAVAAFVICLCGLITRLLPDVWEIAPGIANDRLSYPLTYWNSLGLLTAVGFVSCFALTTDDREPAAGRILGAGALPILASAMLLTFSRGAIAAVAVGLLALVAVGRPRALWSAVLVAVPSVAVAVAWTYAADLLASEQPTTAAAAAQGHGVALVVAVCALLAALGRAAMLRRDPLWAIRTGPGVLRGNPIAWSAGLAVFVAVAIVAGLPGAVSDQVQRLADEPQNTLTKTTARGWRHHETTDGMRTGASRSMTSPSSR